MPFVCDADSNLCRCRKTGMVMLLCLTVLFLFALPGSGRAFKKKLLIELNLNTASIEELQQLPFIGASKARAIVDYRRRHGPFTRTEQLLDSKTVGPETYNAIRPYISLSTSTDLSTFRQDKNGARVLGTFSPYTPVSSRPGEILPLPDKEYYDNLLAAIHNATSRIDLAMFLFKIKKSADNRPAQIMKALIAAAKRGVDIRVLLEKSGYNDKINKENQRVADKLRRHGIRVAFDSPATTTHAKLVVIDNRYVFIGSHNFTHAALALNHEISLLIDNRALAEKMTDYLTGLYEYPPIEHPPY